MDPIRFDRIVQSLASTSRRRLLSVALTVASTVLLGAGADHGLAKKGKKKRKKKKNAPCDPPCGEGTCRNGVCDCSDHDLFACDETCCIADYHGCIDGACCQYDRVCAGECCPDGEECTGGDTCCPRLRACGVNNELCCDEGEACTFGETCCPNAQHCPGIDGGRGTCCDPGEPCVDHVCCPEAITVRGEQCCPAGSGNSYYCGRFKCVYALSQTGPGGCDLWCDLTQEGAGCGPSSLFDGTPGIPTGEGNGRICCCTVPGTYTCVWP